MTNRLISKHIKNNTTEHMQIFLILRCPIYYAYIHMFCCLCCVKAKFHYSFFLREKDFDYVSSMFAGNNISI